jgi:plastocyanin
MIMKKEIQKSTIMLIIFSAMMLTAAIPIFYNNLPIVNSSIPSGHVWYVNIGAQTTDWAGQVFKFYPSIIVIDVNDTIVWTMATMEPHTVTFLSGAPPLNPLNESNLRPMGGNIYNGTGIHSSGLMFMGQTYSLTFTKPGVYPYYCEIHPGMSGIVVVNPAGTPYPKTQEQYNQESMVEEVNDVMNLISAQGNINMPAVKSENGSYIYHVTVGPTIPMSTEVKMLPIGNSGVSGNASISFIAPFTMKVLVNVSGLTPNTSHPIHIHLGTCDYNGPILYYLNTLVADSKGYASSTTIITNVTMLPNVGWYINIHQGPTLSGSGANPIACGNVVYANSAFMTFYPSILTIHVGDTVVWTQVDYVDVHTVTFVPQGMKIPEFGEPLSFAKIGNGSYYNGSGYYNSGIMFPMQTYQLTFTKPGVYTYVCLLHDSMGMIGQIIVLPKPTNTTIVKTTTVTQQYTTTLQGNTTTVYLNQAGSLTYAALGVSIVALILGIVALVIRRAR